MKKVADKKYEKLRLLDENGNLTDKLEYRYKVHEDGLWHQEVGIIPINSKGQVLLQKRSKDKSSYPSCWALCAGHVVKRQTALEAAVTEVNEEIGGGVYKPQDLQLLVEKTKNERDDNKCYATCFYMFLDKPLDYFKKQDEEVDQLIWVDLDTFEKMVKSEDRNKVIFKNNGYYQAIIKNLKQVISDMQSQKI